MIHLLGIAEQDLPVLLQRAGSKVEKNNDGQLCISRKEFLELSDAPYARRAADSAYCQDANRRKYEKVTGEDDIFRKRITDKVGEYRGYIRALEEIHSKYLERLTGNS